LNTASTELKTQSHALKKGPGHEYRRAGKDPWNLYYRVTMADAIQLGLTDNHHQISLSCVQFHFLPANSTNAKMNLLGFSIKITRSSTPTNKRADGGVRAPESPDGPVCYPPLLSTMRLPVKA